MVDPSDKKDATQSSISALLSSPERNMRVSRSSLGLLMAGLPAQSWRDRRISPDGALALTPAVRRLGDGCDSPTNWNALAMPVIQDVSRNVTTRRSYSYTLESRDNSRIVRMYLTCPKCLEETAVSWGHGHFPEKITRYWNNNGWTFDLHRNKNCLCPKCKGKTRPMQTQRAQKPPTLVVTPQEFVKEAEVISELPPQLPRPLTRLERASVRDKLDHSFDDEKGRYRPNWSDKRIAEELDLPLASVRDIREAAYGPINEIDPEILVLRGEFDTLKSMLADCERKLIALERKK